MKLFHPVFIIGEWVDAHVTTEQSQYSAEPNFNRDRYITVGVIDVRTNYPIFDNPAIF